MTYDNELILIGSTITKDEIGQDIETPTRTTILCSKKSAQAKDFYSIGVSSIRPEKVLTVHKFEYSGQRKFIFEGEEYSYIRDFEVNSDEIEITCGRVGANG